MLPIRRAARSLVPVAVATLVAGCAIGPNYKRPDTAVTDQYKNPISATAEAPPEKWWTLFGDSLLNDLEQQVEVSNQNSRRPQPRICRPGPSFVRTGPISCLPSI